MIDVDAFIERFADALRTGKTQAEILEKTNVAAFLAGADVALQNPTNKDKDQVRQLLNNVKAQLKRIDLDHIKVTLSDVNALRDTLSSQIDDALKRLD
jgi:hypothetical protein